MPLPSPINGAEEYLRAIHAELQAIREILSRDRQQPHSEKPDRKVEIREPKKQRG